MSSSPESCANPKFMLFLKDLTVKMKDLINLSLKWTFSLEPLKKFPIYDRLKYLDIMLGGNEHHLFNNPREPEGLATINRHVDYQRLREQDDALHNGLEGRSV